MGKTRKPHAATGGRPWWREGSWRKESHSWDREETRGTGPEHGKDKERQTESRFSMPPARKKRVVETQEVRKLGRRRRPKRPREEDASEYVEVFVDETDEWAWADEKREEEKPLEEPEGYADQEPQEAAMPSTSGGSGVSSSSPTLAAKLRPTPKLRGKPQSAPALRSSAPVPSSAPSKARRLEEAQSPSETVPPRRSSDTQVPSSKPPVSVGKPPPLPPKQVPRNLWRMARNPVAARTVQPSLEAKRLRRQQLQQRGLEERRAKEKAQRQAQQKNDNGDGKQHNGWREWKEKDWNDRKRTDRWKDWKDWVEQEDGQQRSQENWRSWKEWADREQAEEDGQAKSGVKRKPASAPGAGSRMPQPQRPKCLPKPKTKAEPRSHSTAEESKSDSVWGLLQVPPEEEAEEEPAGDEAELEQQRQKVKEEQAVQEDPPKAKEEADESKLEEKQEKREDVKEAEEAAEKPAEPASSKEDISKEEPTADEAPCQEEMEKKVQAAEKPGDPSWSKDEDVDSNADDWGDWTEGGFAGSPAAKETVPEGFTDLDWRCRLCNTINNADRSTCSGCGAVRFAGVDRSRPIEEQFKPLHEERESPPRPRWSHPPDLWLARVKNIPASYDEPMIRELLNGYGLSKDQSLKLARPSSGDIPKTTSVILRFDQEQASRDAADFLQGRAVSDGFDQIFHLEVELRASHTRHVKVLPTVYVSDIPIEWNDQDLYRLHDENGLDSSTIAGTKWQASKRNLTRLCFVRYHADKDAHAAVQQLNMISVDSASEKRKRQLAFKIANPASWHKQNSEKAEREKVWNSEDRQADGGRDNATREAHGLPEGYARQRGFQLSLGQTAEASGGREEPRLARCRQVLEQRQRLGNPPDAGVGGRAR
ncbi:unnamed protein product [Symbiodinium sp. CCMP2592]|nr:unnamed protein product [Symbiodinium sp. CCMP2592]